MKGKRNKIMLNFEIEKLKEEMIDDVFLIEKTFFDVSEKQSIISSLKSDTLEYFVLKIKNRIVGFLECSIVLDEAEIYEIAIKNEFQGKGYSKLLMEYFLKYCDAEKVQTIFLEVNNMNYKAINLYTGFGFKKYSVRKKYYGENDAILMRLDRKI